VFFEATRIFVLGECIQFTLVLEHVDPGHAVRLQCRGRVVRVEPYSNSVGVAVAITGYRLDSRTDRDRECQGGRNEVHACYG
jgi:hypothetical protein